MQTYITSQYCKRFCIGDSKYLFSLHEIEEKICFVFELPTVVTVGARGSVVRDIMLQARRSLVRFKIMSLNFLKFPNPSSRTMTLGSTQPLTEMSTRNLPGGEGRPARKTDNLTAICAPTV
jgi:hypothetical protein